MSRHPDIAYLFEPYFIWDYHCGPGSDDVRTAEMVTPEIADWIRHEFGVLLQRTGRNVFLDKSPFSSFRIPFVNEVYPNGKFIHIHRDGRDVALSTHRKWLERIEYTQEGNYKRFVWEVWDKLRKRPYLRSQVRAIIYELRYNLRFKLRGFYAAYYGGKPGWGVRYPGFEADLAEFTLLQFNALQWLHSVEQIEKDLESIPHARQLTVRYEDFLSDPERTVSQILKFSELPDTNAIQINDVSSDKQITRKATDEELQEIMPHIGDKLSELGYI
jgi:hypothetical protein